MERLRLPDGGVSEDEARHASVTAAVARVIAGTQHRGDMWCLAPWAGDGHPDHEAAGIAAAGAAAGTARLLAYPVWMWHWSTPGDPAVPWQHAHRVELPAEVRAAKIAAIGAFRTQVCALSTHPADAAILPPHILRRLTRPAEVVFGGDIFEENPGKTFEETS